MSASRTDFYLNKQNAKWLGVCSGVADYIGMDVVWVRVIAVLFTFLGGFPWTFIAYFVTAMVAKSRPVNLYDGPEDERFWQRVRSNPHRSTNEVRSTFRDLDRRLADLETLYTSRNSRLADEIDSLR